MSRGNFVWFLLIAGTLGIWGCGRGSENGANAERIRALETKIAKLEEDFKSSVAGREQLRKKLAAVEEERTQQAAQLQTVTKERDDLKSQLALRTNERDALQTQFTNLCKGIKTLLGQAESPSSSSAGQPVTSAAQLQPPGKS